MTDNLKVKRKETKMAKYLEQKSEEYQNEVVQFMSKDEVDDLINGLSKEAEKSHLTNHI